MDYIKDRKRIVFRILSLPIIFFMLIPIFILDILMEVYHRTCFFLYGLDCIERAEHITIDRHKLNYLKPSQKLGCVYCGYANGVMSYWVAIAGRTEKYWCGIAHKNDKNILQGRHSDFIRYGDKKKFMNKYVN